VIESPGGEARLGLMAREEAPEIDGRNLEPQFANARQSGVHLWRVRTLRHGRESSIPI
jgi:hypothetical protein